MASTYIYKDMTGNAPSTKMTYSGWIKKINPDDNGRIFGAQSIACHAYFGGSDGTLNVDFAARDSSSILGIRKPTRLFRDTNAWYHIVFALDTTQGTADDRIKVWINGVQETSFTTKTNPSQNSTTAYGDDGYYSVGARMSQQGGAGHYFDGVMSHVHYCDGYAYQASDFGSTDATTGEWKIKTSPSVTHGTNGFFLKMENSANMDLDSSTNNHSFTTAGTLTSTVDNPSNVFATLNALQKLGNSNTSLTYGNTRYYTTSSAWGNITSTLGFSSGKFYVEGKVMTLNSSTGYGSMGIIDSTRATQTTGNESFTATGNTAGMVFDYRSGQSNFYSGGSTVSSNIGDFSNNDIIGMAIDMDNKALYIHKAGTYYQIGGVTGVPTSGASKTGAITFLQVMATSEQQQYLVQELTQVIMEYLNMMYQQVILLYQQKD
jgi:hypothetical protein